MVAQYRAPSSIREIGRLTFIATLALFFIAETMLAQDVIVVRPVVAVISSIAVILWYWGQDRRVT
jgi:hypothetical protein